MSFEMKNKQKNYCKYFHFIIFFERSSNIELLHELPFHNKSSAVEISKAFKRYTRSYKIEIKDSTDPLTRLEASKLSIEKLFKDLLNEMQGFKYQIIVAVLLCKHKHNGDIDYAPVYFNSASKAVLVLTNMILINFSRNFIQNRQLD